MTVKMKHILIGLFVTGALTALIGMILFLEPSIGNKEKTLYVRFANIAGITVGTRVTFAGKPVGEVTEIQEIKNAREEHPDVRRRIYFYQLTLKVDSSVVVYNTDEIAIRTTGLLGEKSVAIIPRAAPPGKLAHPIKEGQILTANSTDPIENTINEVGIVATHAKKLIGHLDCWFQANAPLLTHALQSLDSTLTHASALLLSAEEQQLIPAFRETAQLFNDNLALVKESLEQDQLLHRVATLISHLNQTAESFNSDGIAVLRNLEGITRDLLSGTGTLGRLITEDDLYLRLSSLLSKAETVVNDINHYGLLFQYDKHWQRSRTKRANLLKALDTPKEFRAYFEGEVDAITTSLGRLTDLLQRSQESCEREKIAETAAFRKQFATLLRSVESLSDSIRLYNEELVAQSKD